MVKQMVKQKKIAKQKKTKYKKITPCKNWKTSTYGKTL